MKPLISRRGLVAAALWALAAATPAAAATVAVDPSCIRRLSDGCAGPVSGAARPVGPGPAVGDIATGNGLSLILARSDGAALRQAGPALALLRLFSAAPGTGDARLWLVDAARTGGVGLFYLRFQRQTWTAGLMGDMPMDLPMAAMAATRSGALAFNAP